jgi:hypothetical protein
VEEGAPVRADIPGRGIRPFKIVHFLVAICTAAVAIALYQWHDTRAFFEPASLLSRFPAEDGTALHIDFKSLRQAGLLADTGAAREPEYRQFVDGTGLDYRRDLDLVVASFSKSGNYFIARGRFDWNKLRDYATRQGGSCYQQLCRMPGSTPERHISFLPLRPETIAVAVSTDDLAAARLAKTGPPVLSHLPGAPVWLSVPGSALQKPNALPPGVRLLVSALMKADRVLLAAGPGSPGTEAHGFEAHLDAGCRSAEDARILASQLRAATGMLKEALLTDKEAGQDGLARALAAGTFDASGPKVSGKWPLPKNLIESLTAGI